MKRYLWTLNVLFLLGFSYFVADLLSLFIGRQLDTPARTASVEWAATTEAQVKPAGELYSAIVDRNIFGIKPVAAVAALPENLPSVQLPPLLVRLVGTIVGEEDGEESMAIIEDTGTKEQRLYRIEDIVGTDARLVGINRNEVTFLRGTIRETLEVQEDGAPSQPMQAMAPVSSAAPRMVGGQSQWVLDKREVTAALENLPQLLTKARVIPNLSPDGKNDGFRVVSISPASFYERIGLRNGDVIQRINGVEVKDPQTFMQVFGQLKDESSISLDLMRNNQKESFSYEIR